MSILAFILVGAVAGWISGELARGSGFSMGSHIITGIVGAYLGGSLLSMFNVDEYGALGSLSMALAGAGIALFLLNVISSRSVNSFWK